MKKVVIFAYAAILVIATASWAFADSAGRLYGRIKTADGDVYEGFIRWDKNEASWFDILNGDKTTHDTDRGRRHHERIRVFGIVIGERWTAGDVGSAQSGLSFGHIKSLEPLGRNTLRVTLKSGDTVRLEGGSSDIGTDIRQIVIEDAKEGEIEFDWDEIESIELMQGPANLTSAFGDRLYGTLTTRRGDEYAGWVSWDADELFTKDVMDGEQKDHTRRIPFERIRSIERYNSNGAALKLAGGEEIVLRETNDVDDSNRGIAIYDPAIGQVTVDWDEFDRLEFKTPPAPLVYAAFDGGRRLAGTVYTDDDEKYTGSIRWDDDEQYTWEVLDGDYHDETFDIEFSKIKEIKPQGYHAALVTLWDGRTFRMSGTNDVDEDNKGIFVDTGGGKEFEVDWKDVDRVEFSK